MCNLLALLKLNFRPVRILLMVAVLFAGKLEAQIITLSSPSDFTTLKNDLNQSTTNSTLTFIFAFNGTMTITEPLFVDGNILLETPTNFSVTLTASPNVRPFQVDPNSTLTMSNFTFSGINITGQTGMNGISQNNLNNGQNGGNGTTGTNVFGGVIFNQGTNIVMNCLFLTNTITGGTGGLGGGGGDPEFVNGVAGSGGNGGNGGTALGGAIFNQNTLVVSNCAFAGNFANGGNGAAGGTNGVGSQAFAGGGGAGALGAGGALFNAGNATIVASTFQDNFAAGGNSLTAGGKPGGNGNGPKGAPGGNGQGGGLFNMGTNVVVNCTFAENFASGGAGGNGGVPLLTSDQAGAGGNGGNGTGAGLCNSNGMMFVTNCTFADGTVIAGTNGLVASVGLTNNGEFNGNPGILQGANIANLAGTFALANSILAYPTNGSNVFGTFTDKGFNISSDTTPPAFTSPTSVKNTDPLLVPLSANGGPTLTMELEKHSPAVAAITNGSAPVLDQRGFIRPFPPAFQSIGAFEFNAATFSISGLIFPTGSQYTNVTVVATGSSGSQAVFVNKFGGYVFTGLAADTYVITPQATNGFSFSPVNLQVTVPTATGNAIDQDFTATPSFNVGGIITNLAGTATLFIFTNSGANNTFVSQTQSGASNIYTFTNLPAGNYIVIPQPTSTTAFNPSSEAVTLTTTNNTNINFTAVPPVFTVTGQITGLSAPVSVAADLGSSSVQFSSTVTDGQGNYSFTNLIAGSYTIVPQSGVGFTYSPPSFFVTVPPSTNNQNFVATASGGSQFSISGRVMNLRASATIKATQTGGSTLTTTTDGSGNYSFSNLGSGAYTVTPSPINGATFSPTSIHLNSVPPSATGQNFAVMPTTNATASGLHITNGNAIFSLNGFPNVTYRIQASTNLQTWVDIQTNTAAANGFLSVTNSVAGFSNQFFRAVTP